MTFSRDYLPGGDTQDFSKATGLAILCPGAPVQVYVQSREGGAISCWVYALSRGSAQDYNLAQVFGQPSTSSPTGVLAPKELAEITYSPSITLDSVVFKPTFLKLQ